MLFQKNRVLCSVFAVVVLLSCCSHGIAWGMQGDTVVILDAGHGGEDGGAVAADGTPESGINLQITKKLEWLLLFTGYHSILTREGDEAVYSPEATTLRQKKVSDLKNRVALINGTENAFVISIHQNSLPSHPNVHGAKVFFNTILPAAQAGSSVQETLNLAVNPGNERPVTAIDSTIYLMKESVRPAILVECGFLSNPAESKQLQDPSYQTRLVTAIAAGFIAFDTGDRGSTYEE